MTDHSHSARFFLRSIVVILIYFVFLLTACASEIPTVVAAAPTRPASVNIITPTPFLPEKLPEPALVPTVILTPDEEKSLPDPAAYQWKLMFTGFTKPVDLASPPGEPNRIVVLEQKGLFRLIQDGKTLDQPFMDIHAEVGSGGSEQGLLGIAFHPEYQKNHFFYVNYTDKRGNTVIARFTANGNGQTVDPQSEKRLLNVNQPFANHNGGGLAFGPDGYLYIGLGDGGSAGDPQSNGQNTNTLLGKLLRIDINQADGYSIPKDNPFAAGGGKPEIWAYGLRNPWRFSFDKGTGDLFIGDVGQDLWEEVDYLKAGSAGGTNFGWNIKEGNHVYHPRGNENVILVNPITEYSHTYGCAITGGYVYRGLALPQWQGVYFFGDYCQGTVWGLLQTSAGVEVKPVDKINGSLSSFGVDGNGELYALEYKRGEVYRLEAR